MICPVQLLLEWEGILTIDLRIKQKKYWKDFLKEYFNPTRMNHFCTLRDGEWRCIDLCDVHKNRSHKYCITWKCMCKLKCLNMNSVWMSDSVWSSTHILKHAWPQRLTSHYMRTWAHFIFITSISPFHLRKNCLQISRNSKVFMTTH